jgi:hypothetical protein
VALVEAGYELEQVEQWLDDKPEQMSLEARVKLLKLLAEAAQAFGLAGVWGPLAASAAPSGLIYSQVEDLVKDLEPVSAQKAIPG